MSHFEFCIPIQKDDLLESHAGKYHVEDVVQPRLLLSKLQGLYQCLYYNLYYRYTSYGSMDFGFYISSYN